MTEPQLGDTCTRHNGTATTHYLWAECPMCHKCRWVTLRYGMPRSKSTLCFHCNVIVQNRKRWKAGISFHPDGYTLVVIPRDSFFSSMTYNQRILEHRLIMAQHLGRCLASWELVHHKNGDRSDNRIENLELAMRGQHSIQHNLGYKDGFNKGLADRRQSEITRLWQQIAALAEQNIKLQAELIWHESIRAIAPNTKTKFIESMFSMYQDDTYVKARERLMEEHLITVNIKEANR